MLRRELGEDKREFELPLKKDWLEFDRRRKRYRRSSTKPERQVFSVEGADAVI